MKHILVVDDEYDFLQALALVLTVSGYRVSTATDGDECLASLRIATPDLVVLDIMMPVHSGLDVLRNLRDLRAAEEWRALPILVISGARPALPSLAGGPVEFLQKPFAFDEIITSVTRLVGEA